jgi:hypothetical protein
MAFYEDAMEIVDALDPEAREELKAIIEEVMKVEGGKVERAVKIVSLDEARLAKAKAKAFQKEKEMRGSIKILALDGSSGNMGAEGYMDDGSDSYKRFAVDSNGKLHIMAEYSKSKYGNEYAFREVMGKFDPDVFFMRDGVEVDSMDLATLSDVYWSNYDG